MVTETPRQYLFCAWDGGGNVPPQLGLAKRLVKRGHRVTVLGDATIEPEAIASGARFRPWSASISRTSLDPESDPLKDWEVKSPPALFKRMNERLLAGPAPEYCADALAAIDELSPDAAAVDNFLFGALIACEKAGLPTASLVPNIYPWPRPGVPPVGPGLAPATGSMGHLRDSLMRKIVSRLWGQALPAINELRREHGLSELASIFEQPNRADRVLVLTSAAFDLEGPLPDHVHYVGAVLDDPAWATAWQSPWDPEDPRPLVLVSLSSTFQNQGDVLQRIITALDGQNLRALVTVGPAIAATGFETPPNVVVTEAAPHAAVLPQADAVVTHAGHGTVIKALATGLPLVCLPMGRDQNDTAARVAHHGAGIRLRLSADSTKIGNAVDTVLADSSYREAASRLASSIAEDLEDNRGVDELERLVSSDWRSDQRRPTRLRVDRTWCSR